LIKKIDIKKKIQIYKYNLTKFSKINLVEKKIINLKLKNDLLSNFPLLIDKFRKNFNE